MILKNKNLKKDKAALTNIIFYEITAKMYRIFFFVLTGNPVMLAGAMESIASGACGRGVDGDSPGEGLPPEGGEEGLPLRFRGGVHGHLLPPPQSGVLLCHSEGTGTSYMSPFSNCL